MFELFRNIFFDAPADQGAAAADAPADAPADTGGDNPFDGNFDFDSGMAVLDAADGSPFGRDPAELRGDPPDESDEGDDTPVDEPDADETEQADTDAAKDTPEPETASEGDADAPAAEEKADTPKLDFSAIEAVIPGAVIESMDDLVQHVSTYRDSHEVLSQFEQIVDGDQHLMEYLAARKDGMEAHMAAIKAFGTFAKVPDSEEDPEGFGDWRAEQKAAQVRSEYEKRQQQDQKQRLQRLATSAQETFDGTAKRLNLSSEDKASLASLFESLTKGDPVTGRFPSRAFEILHQGRQAVEVQSGIESALAAAKKGPEGLKSLQAADGDQPIVKSVKQALRDAYLAGAKTAGNAKKKVPQVPDLTGSRGGDISDADQETQQFARSLQSEDWVATAKRQGVYQNGK